MSQLCPQCGNTMDYMPINPMWDTAQTFPMATTTTDANSVTYGSTTGMVQTKSTYKCCNPTCWVTKVTVEWE